MFSLNKLMRFWHAPVIPAGAFSLLKFRLVWPVNAHLHLRPSSKPSTLSVRIAIRSSGLPICRELTEGASVARGAGRTLRRSKLRSRTRANKIPAPTHLFPHTRSGQSLSIRWSLSLLLSSVKATLSFSYFAACRKYLTPATVAANTTIAPITAATHIAEPEETFGGSLMSAIEHEIARSSRHPPVRPTRWRMGGL
jgi:hypothetical protein